MNDELTPIALKFGTDKASSHHYTKNYDRHFREFKNLPVNILEIGIGGDFDEEAGGASLKMWQEYFSKGNIYGLDIAKKPLVKGQRIKTYVGSQADPVTIAKILNDVGENNLDIIIDDGSHRPEHVIASFLMLFQHLKHGGFYVVEDVQTTYWSPYGGGTDTINRPLSVVEFFKSFIDSINWQEIHRPGYQPNYFDLNIVSMHFYHNMIFIEKGHNQEGSNVVVNNVYSKMNG